MKNFSTPIGLAAALVFAGSMAWADSISPESFEATMRIGESVTITKTVTVDEGKPTTAKADIFFLVDTSGSMGGVISAVKTRASEILTGTAGFGDVAWGVGSYEDFPRSPWGASGDLPWRLNQAVTTVPADAQAGINALTLRSGGDGPESNLEALYQTATNASVGWRDGSKRFIVWFGDVRGHDPVSCADQGIAGCTNPATAGYPGPTLTATIAALDDKDIQVIGINRQAGTTGTGIDETGQASAIIDAVGGELLSLAGAPAGTIVGTILGSLETAFATYSSVDLMPAGHLPGVDVAWTPLFDPGEGPWTREETRSFDFEVTFTGLKYGVHDFEIHALVDRGIVATEKDRITVVPLPAAAWLLLGGLGALAALRRRRRA